MNIISRAARSIIYRGKRRFAPAEWLDDTYGEMHRQHVSTHGGIVAEMASIRDRENLNARVLEIACGSGRNIATFLTNGFVYTGMDLSETAIAIAVQRHRRGSFLNMPASDLPSISTGAFDMVYNSAMLEHVGEHAEILKEMIRITRKHLFVVFYEGLLEGETRITHHPVGAKGLSKVALSPYGQKWADYQAGHQGYFMNRYGKAEIVGIAESCGVVGAEVLAASNRSFVTGGESVLHVWK